MGAVTKSDLWGPKSDFWGAGSILGRSPGGSKIAFWGPKEFREGFGAPKMEAFGLQNASGTENLDFVEM